MTSDTESSTAQTVHHIEVLRKFIDQHATDATSLHLVRSLRSIESAAHYWQRAALRAFRLATGSDYRPDAWPAGIHAALDAFDQWHAGAADIDSQLERDTHHEG